MVVIPSGRNGAAMPMCYPAKLKHLINKPWKFGEKILIASHNFLDHKFPSNFSKNASLSCLSNFASLFPTTILLFSCICALHTFSFDDDGKTHNQAYLTKVCFILNHENKIIYGWHRACKNVDFRRLMYLFELYPREPGWRNQTYAIYIYIHTQTKL